MNEINIDAVNAAYARKSLWEFLQQAWPVIDPAPLEANWHMKVVCDAVQACLTGKANRNLIINVPPGTSKSTIVSVMAPAWMLLQDASWSGIFASGNPRGYIRDSMKCRDLIRSDWYQQTFRPGWKISDDQDQKTLFKTTAGGQRIALGTGSGVTSLRAKAIFVDDPIDASDALSKIVKDGANSWYDSAYSNRLNDMRTGCRIVVMQRLAVDDLSGHLLERQGYDHLCLPMEFDPERADRRDIRKVKGEVLDPRRFTPEVLAEERAKGSLYYAGQYQQIPYDADGNLFKPSWFRFYQTDNPPHRPASCNSAPAIPLPDLFDELLSSWDCAFKETKNSDFVAGGIWGRKGANVYLLARFRKRTGFAGTLDAIRMLTNMTFGKKNQIVRKHLVEDKANGSAVIEMLRDEIPGIIAVNPEGGKVSRANSVSAMFEAGNVYLPEGAPWLDEYISEFAAFPVGPHDDEVDQTTQALVVLNTSRNSIGARFAAAAKEGRLLNARPFWFR